MSCCGRPDCTATATHFGQVVAEADLKRYQSTGPDKRARLLLQGLVRAGVKGSSVLDIGSGIGVMTFELLKQGAATAVLADAAPAYLDAARAEAARGAVTDRVQFARGNFVDTSRDIAPADVVVLDRVVCCYPEWQALLELAAARCRRVLGVSYPWNRPDIRLMIGFENLRRRLSGNAFRAFVHPPTEMHRTLQNSGLQRVSRAHTFAWHIDVYVRKEKSLDGS